MKNFFVLSAILAMAFRIMGQVSVTFTLNMDSLIGESLFFPASGDRNYRGVSFNHWQGTDHELKASFGLNIYSGTFVINGSEGDTVDYKFVIVKERGRSFRESNPNRVVLMEDDIINGRDPVMDYALRLAGERMRVILSWTCVSAL
jgi:hypothetical protein